MWQYVVRRILYVVPTLLGVNLLVFALFFVVNSPDDMAKVALGEKGSSPEQIQMWKASRGYDKPLLWNGAAGGFSKLTDTVFCSKSLSMLWGEFGRSDMTREPIGAEILRRIPPSLCVMFPIFMASLCLNIILAMTAVQHRHKPLDTRMQVACVVLMSISSLIYIIGGQFLLAKLLRLVPVSGFVAGTDMWLFLTLPVCVGVACGLGPGVRLYRTLFMEEINKDYVRTARAKGLSERQILYRHVLKNAMIPILTNLPLQLLSLMMGNMLLENFFSVPGLGAYTINALQMQDFAIVRCMVFLGACLYMLGMLLADVCCIVADPRIRV